MGRVERSKAHATVRATGTTKVHHLTLSVDGSMANAADRATFCTGRTRPQPRVRRHLRQVVGRRFC